MTDIVELLREFAGPQYPDNISGKQAMGRAADEIERLHEYENLVKFIANDYHELSQEKAMWQRDDWKARAQKLIKGQSDE